MQTNWKVLAEVNDQVGNCLLKWHAWAVIYYNIYVDIVKAEKQLN